MSDSGTDRVQREDGHWEHPNPLVEELSWVVKGWAKEARYDIAVAVVEALKPEFQRREREAAQRERDRLAVKARSFPNGGLHVDAGAVVNGQQQWMTLSAWLSIQDDTADTADRTEAGR